MSSHKYTPKMEEMQTILGEYAREANAACDFSQRNTALTAERFVQVVTLGWLQDGTASLNTLAMLAQELGIQITGAALHERMQRSAVKLLQTVLVKSLHAQVRGSRPVVEELAQFRAIHVTDSTIISLPQRLYEEFTGSNGDAQMKVQVTVNYLTGEWVGIEVMAGKSADQRSTLPVRHASAGSLNIQDLGYFKQEHLRDIAGQDAFFVSRYKAQTALYAIDTGERLDLIKQLQAVPDGGIYDKQVCLGQRVKLPVRLVARRLPQAAAAARRRKAKNKAKEQGQTCSTSYLYLLGWDILVTNLDPALWSVDRLFDLYAIRMQLEWVFRIWKSQLKVDHFGTNWRRERVLCQFYAHLIGIFLCHRLTRGWLWVEGHEHSVAKCVTIIQSRIGDLMRCIRRHWYGSRAWLRRLEESFRLFGRKTNRKKDPSTLQILMQAGLS